MALHIHRAERTDVLADGLGALLATPPPDPFAQDLVVVPARGVERWLSQRLSHILGRGTGSDGICAGVSFRSPASLIAEIAGTGQDDPWSPEAMTWPLLEVIDASLDEPWCRTLADHLGHFADGEEGELRAARRYAVTRRIAGLFASYARQRPGLLADWLAGDTADLMADLAWQPHLWRRLVEVMAIDPPHIRHAKTVALLRESGAGLPDRLSLFGHTRLPATEVELLDAVAAHHELHLWLPHPSAQAWEALADLRGVVARRDDDSHRRIMHPLLATLGRDLRELQRSLPDIAATDEALTTEASAASGSRPDTLLGWLQADISANAVRPQGRSLRPEDRSVQIHSCHSPARQVDVLREVLLGLLVDDETLEPRDILVMCPDIERYAPLIAADFGLGDVVSDGHPAHRLRVRLADRSLVQTNPLLQVAAQLLSLAGSRVTATEVLNLAQSAPVRDRFGFTDDDLEDITRWVREANIRWGFDQEHRTPYGVDFVHNTWRFGLDRVLAGVALSDDSPGWIGNTLPLDDVGSNSVELTGRLTEYVDRLRGAVDSLTGTRGLRDWLGSLAEAIRLITRVGDADAWQISQLEREFNEVLERAGSRRDTMLRLPDIHSLLHQHLAGRPTRANFRTGTLTVCTMVPMRSVPHRVVCLVGLDDTVFPRIGVADGDDALAREPMTGERDIRSEDRQLLLDAIGAATETLVITYTGANDYTGQPCPPAVPVAELLDALDITTEGKVRKNIVVHHPLQPFDARNVESGALVPGHPFSFDTTVLRAARAATADRAERPAFVSGPLSIQAGDGDIALADLLTFFRDPVRGFFRALDYTFPADVDGVDDAMPVEIDALQEWTVGDRMLTDIMRGMSPDRAREAEWCRGTLPPGRLGWRRATDIRDQVALLADEALPLRTGPARAIDVDIDLGSGRRLTGTVAPVFGNRLVTATYSKLDGKHLLAAWIPLLALTAHAPGVDWSAACIGRPKRGTQPRREFLGRPDVEAVELLGDLVAIYDAGRSEPIPLPLKTSYAWAQARYSGDDPVAESSRRWRSSGFPGDDQQPAHARVWGSGAPLSHLMQPVRPGEEHPGEDNRLGAYAARLWLPMLRAQRGSR